MAAVKLKLSEVEVLLLEKEGGEGLRRTPSVRVVKVWEESAFPDLEEIENPVIHNFADNVFPGGRNSTCSSEGRVVYHPGLLQTREDAVVDRLKDEIAFPLDMYPICLPGEEEPSLIYHRTTPPVLSLPQVFAKKAGIGSAHRRIELVQRMKLLLACARLLGPSTTLVTGSWCMNPRAQGFGDFTNSIVSETWLSVVSTYRFVPARVIFCARGCADDIFSPFFQLSARLKQLGPEEDDPSKAPARRRRGTPPRTTFPC